MALQQYICGDCGEAMTPEEVAYFDYRCAACEEQWHARVQDWKFGAPDAELDLLYSIKEPIKH